MSRHRLIRENRCAVEDEGHLPPLPTTQDFVALDDHARLPWRFFGRFTASLAAGLRRG